MKISVIIPVFNCEKYLTESVKSVLQQDYNNLELILVDDASTDRSNEVCLKLEKQDNRIITISKSRNEKALNARISGLKVATGDFIVFFDADDYMPSKAISSLINLQMKTKADITLGAFVYYYDRFRFLKSKPRNLANGSLINRTFSHEEIQESFKYAFFGIHSIPISSWAKLFKKHLFTEFIKYNHPKIHAFDDTYLNLLIFPLAKKISFTSDIVYFYRYGGYTSNFDFSTLHDLNHLFLARKNHLALYPDLNAEQFSLIEIKNTIKSYFLNAIHIKRISYSDFVTLINSNKNLEIFTALKETSFSDIIYDDLIEKIIGERYSEAYQQLYYEYKRLKFRRRIKRLLGQFLRKI